MRFPFLFRLPHANRTAQRPAAPSSVNLDDECLLLLLLLLSFAGKNQLLSELKFSRNIHGRVDRTQGTATTRGWRAVCQGRSAGKRGGAMVVGATERPSPPARELRAGRHTALLFRAVTYGGGTRKALTRSVREREPTSRRPFRSVRSGSTW